MSYRVRLFVDFWNYQLHYNQQMGPSARCDWSRLPAAFVAAAEQTLNAAGVGEPLALEETRVYASYNPSRAEDVRLRTWLSNFLDRQPSFRVFVTQRKDKSATFRCRDCGQVFGTCPACGEPLVRSREKGVDTAIVTDMLSLAWESAFDVAILVSADADMIPCVQRIQEKGLKVINATWPGLGFDLAKACWASFDARTVAQRLLR